jgi:hypothetical protein
MQIKVIISTGYFTEQSPGSVRLGSLLVAVVNRFRKPEGIEAGRRLDDGAYVMVGFKNLNGASIQHVAFDWRFLKEIFYFPIGQAVDILFLIYTYLNTVRIYLSTV